MKRGSGLSKKDRGQSREAAEAAETARLELLAAKEEALMRRGFRYVAGLDEAGRGPLAGPVTAAAVILPYGFRLRRLNDSKKLSPGVREKLARSIREEAVDWAVGWAGQEEIEAVNILEAAKRAMTRALDGLSHTPDYVLLDALTLPGVRRQEGIVGGDALCACISAASVLAKTARDRYMEDLDREFPLYGFGKHKGYGTREHVAAIRKYGPCPAHRMSFLSRIWPVPAGAAPSPEPAETPRGRPERAPGRARWTVCE
jgi:ribonuclease HII